MESNIVSAIFLPASLFLIMFGLGLTLLTDDFKRLLDNPRATLLGVSLQILALPLIAFLLANTLLKDSPVMAVGLMILAVCPGGATSNLITYLARGDIALSVTLTAISSFIAVITIPLLLHFSLNWFMGESETVSPPILEMVGQVVAITIVPVSLGIVVRRKSETFAAKAEKPMKILSAVLLAVIVLGLVANERAQIVGFFKEAGLATLLLNLIMLALGFTAGAIARLPLTARVSLSIEAGIQNGTLGIAIAAGILKNGQMAIAPAIYSLIMFATGIIAILIFSRMVSAAEPEIETRVEATAG